MTYAVRIRCGGNRGDFLLSRGVVQPNGDIEPGPVQEFDTFEEAMTAGGTSTIVEVTGWPWSVEEHPREEPIEA